jgi:hypothetical protein
MSRPLMSGAPARVFGIPRAGDATPYSLCAQRH